MSSHIPSYLLELPVYKQAMQISMLSRSISTYLNQDLAYLKDDGVEDDSVYFSGDIVQQSVSLAPEIINASLETASDKKHKHILTLKRLTNRLIKTCKRLQTCPSNGREYLPILQKEIKTFKSLQRHWLLSL